MVRLENMVNDEPLIMSQYSDSGMDLDMSKDLGITKAELEEILLEPTDLMFADCVSVTSVDDGPRLKERPRLNERPRVTPSVGKKGKHKKARHVPSRREKKQKGMPKRPLSAYNLFFKRERPIICNEYKQHGKPSGPGFEDMGRIIGIRWHALSLDERKKLEVEAQKDALRYRKEMAIYKLQQEQCEKATKSPPPTQTPAIIDSSDFKPIPISGRSSPTVVQDKILSASTTPIVSPVRARLPNSTPADVYRAALGKNSDAHLISPASSQVLSPASSQVHTPASSQVHLNHHHQQHQTLYNNGGGLLMTPPNTPRASVFYPNQTSPPMVPSLCDDSCEQHDTKPTKSRPPTTTLRNGAELYIPDANGRQRRYIVSYTCHRMTRAEADAYMLHGQMGIVETMTKNKKKKRSSMSS